MQNFCKELENAESIHSLNGILQKYFYEEGIGSFALTYYYKHTKTGNKIIYHWVSPALKPWHEYYIDQGFADSDRTLELAEHSLLPIFWDVKEQLRQAKNKKEQQIREESIAFGIDLGLSIPVYAPQGDFIILVLHQRQGEDGLVEWKSKQYEWFMIALHYFQQLRKYLSETLRSAHGLTKREQQCLALTSQGLRLEAIAQALDLSNRTVNFHLQNANRKLGVNNKYLAILRWQEGLERNSIDEGGL